MNGSESGNKALYFKIVPEDYTSMPEYNNTKASLALISNPKDYRRDPDIFISTHNTYPDPLKGNYEIGCWYIGLDVCFLPK